MGVDEVLGKLMRTLAQVSASEPYLGVTYRGDMGEPTSVFEEGALPQCDPFTKFSYLDSSSRMINVKGANIYFASLYGNDGGRHVMVPTYYSVPFIAMKASETTLTKVKTELGRFVLTENVNGERYTEDYKDDNILDELRISLENSFIGSSTNPVIVDGPVIPGPYLPMVGEPYKAAFEKLITQRKKDRLVGVVKRLSFTRKLSREENVRSSMSKLVGATDDVIVYEMAKRAGNPRVFFTPIYKESLDISGTNVTRYMVYVKVMDSVFRVESTDKDLLCRGAMTSIRDPSVRGIPNFIEVADRISKRLSASTFIMSFMMAKSLIGVNYEDWNTYNESVRDINE